LIYNSLNFELCTHTKFYNVFTKNNFPLDSSLEEALYHEFKRYGEIINIIIKGNTAQKYAYVQFSK